ncbi:hypothetical protein BH20BAC1_BH20BAC1_08780 [soil metagenome]
MPKCQLRTAFAGLVFIFLLNWGCTKIDTTTLGQGLIPAVDNINTFDTTFDIIVNNFDSLPGECDSVSISDQHALGIINNDPLFGNSKGVIYAEFKPNNFPFVFTGLDSMRLDSVILVLHYAGSFGDTMVQQSVQVFPLLMSMQPDSAYPTCNLLPYDEMNMLGEKTFMPKDLDDSVFSFNERATNQLRIKLDTLFIHNLLADTTVLRNDSTFRENFKGFAIVPDESAGGNALNYFSLIDVSTRLSIYFTSTKVITDTVVVDFNITSSSGTANSLIRERNNAEITNHTNHLPGGDEFAYVQTTPGSYVELKIPDLSNLSNRVIHRAEIIAEQVYTGPSDEIFFTPPLLFLDIKDTSQAGKYIPVPCDFTISGSSAIPDFNYLGGVRASYDDGQGHSLSRYVFNISRYMQNIVTKRSDNATLRLKSPFRITNKKAYLDRCGQLVRDYNFTTNNIGQGRVKLYGTKNTSRHLRLHVVYSNL